MMMDVPDYLYPSDMEDALPRDFFCCLCYSVLVHPMEGSCRHRVCVDCFQQLNQANDRLCPVCRRPVTLQGGDQTFRDTVRQHVRTAMHEQAMTYVTLDLSRLTEPMIRHWRWRCTDVENVFFELRRFLIGLELLARDVASEKDQAARSTGICVSPTVCCSAQEMRDLPHRNAIPSLVIEGVDVADGGELNGFDSVGELKLKGCPRLCSLEGVAALSSLTRLTVEDCDLSDAAGLRQCRSLRVLRFVNCPNLHELTLISTKKEQDTSSFACQDGRPVEVCQCPELSTSKSNSCAPQLCEFRAPASKITGLGALASHDGMEVLDLHDCAAFADAPQIGFFRNLVFLDLSNTAIRSLDGLRGCRKLRELRFCKCGVSGNLCALADMRELRVLDASHTSIDSLDGLGGCLDMRALTAASCTALTDIAALRRLTKLVRVNLSSTAISDISSLIAFDDVVKIDLRGCQNISDLSPWREFSRAGKLRVLLLSNTRPRSIAVWRHCPANLRILDLCGCDEIDNIDVLHDATRLEVVLLAGTRVRDISALSACAPTLQLLALEGTRVGDISVLSAAVRLEALGLRGTAVTDIAPLRQCAPVLQQVGLKGTDVCDIAALRSAARLVALDLTGTKVEDISALATCAPGLLRLVLENTRVRDISVLGSATQLEMLNLRGASVTTIPTSLPTSTVIIRD